MTRLIQIAPGVLFSSDVLSPEWGRQRQKYEKADRATTGAAQPTPAVPRVALERQGPASDADCAQLSLLLDI
ncbi:hypothetical protein [Burkholderia vietnamiensis]|uniref:hypothetical protein n=1 Tax=Burkholderia vietnamiensis TaxID=60552 RepID=UPI001BA10CC4|nr:hypothetical protein [Burkholderia vietnamiensis]MBR8034724.1 hypothetical protein [Burkholderia vietnamiensis]